MGLSPPTRGALEQLEGEPLPDPSPQRALHLSSAVRAVAYEIAQVRGAITGNNTLLPATEACLTQVEAGGWLQLKEVWGPVAEAFAEEFGSLATAAGTLAPMATVFITGATCEGGGSVSGKVYESGTSPANKVLTEFDSDDDDVTITVEIHAATDAWQPTSVTVSGGGATPVQVDAVDWTQVASTRIWTATARLTDADTSGTITATLSTGDTATCDYDRLLDPPVVSSVQWGENNGGFSAGTYPTSPDTGLQTAVKATDTVDIQFTLDSSATRVTVEHYGATGGYGSDQHFDGSYGAGTHVIEGVVVGTGTGSKIFRVKANRDGGSYGSSSDSQTILLDQVSHSYSGVHNEQYPGSNFALGSGDSVDADLEITNWVSGDYASYTSPSGQVTIGSPTTYAETKTYTYASGDYNDDTDNVTLTSRRKANGKQSSTTYLIEIANAAPEATVVITGNPDRLRSRATGGDKTYTVTLQSNQKLQAADLERDSSDGGAIPLPALSGDPGGDKTWTATITIKETDPKCTGATVWDWEYAGSWFAKNGAAKTVAVLSDAPSWQPDGSSQYTVGGFEERDVAMDPYEEYNPIGTQATNKDNPNKLSCEIVGVKELEYVANTTPAVGKFTITDSGGNFDADGNYVRCLDTDFIGLGMSYDLRTEESE